MLIIVDVVGPVELLEPFEGDQMMRMMERQTVKAFHTQQIVITALIV